MNRLARLPDIDPFHYDGLGLPAKVDQAALPEITEKYPEIKAHIEQALAGIEHKDVAAIEYEIIIAIKKALREEKAKKLNKPPQE